MVLCNSALPLVIYFLAFWSRAFITECRFEVCKWDFNLVTWYPVTQIFIAKTCGVLTCTRQQDNSGRYNSIIVSVDTLITGSYNAVMSWEHLGHRRPKLSLWGVTFFFKKSLCEPCETSYRDIVTAVIHCYITTLRETWLWPLRKWRCYVTTVWIYKGLYGGKR